ncbi:hypothetical protein, partial [Metallibacterium scheffleri]|uniref:hypothetical protein n=1 Tax=Metallibacterium scheffleri TaxID=993689 RepID=UPI0023F37BC3
MRRRPDALGCQRSLLTCAQSLRQRAAAAPDPDQWPRESSDQTYIRAIKPTENRMKRILATAITLAHGYAALASN